MYTYLSEYATYMKWRAGAVDGAKQKKGIPFLVATPYISASATKRQEKKKKKEDINVRKKE